MQMVEMVEVFLPLEISQELKEVALEVNLSQQQVIRKSLLHYFGYIRGEVNE